MFLVQKPGLEDGKYFMIKLCSLFVLITIIVLLIGCQNLIMTHEPARSIQAPMADIRPSEGEYHGISLHDDYLWLKDSSYSTTDDEDILACLRSENRWFEHKMLPRRDSVETLFGEMKGRIEDDETTVPWNESNYTYRWRYTPGSQYKIWERKPKSGEKFVSILDELKEASGREFFALGVVDVSPYGKLLAWTYDANGSERNRLIVNNLDTRERYEDELDVEAPVLNW
jgi:oligopeptidase B